MNEVKFEILKAILEYMYLGEVHLSNENLKEFIKTAESLQIRGLTSKDSSQQEQTVGDNEVEQDEEEEEEVEEEDEEVQVRTADDLVIFDEYCRKRQYATNDSNLKKVKIAKLDTEVNATTVLTEKVIESTECNLSSDSGQQQDQNLSTSSTQLSNNSSKQVEMKIEMLEEYAQQAQQQQQQQSSPTYCNMDSFGNKSDGKSVVDPNRPSTSYQLQATPTQQQPQQLTQTQHQTQYKIDDEIWLETTLMHNPQADQSSKKRPNSTSPTQQTQAQQQQQNKSQNCLTPRSCPLCSRTYSNVIFAKNSA
jgi:hypothetical protein